MAACSTICTRGEIYGGLDTDLALDLIYGPIYYRLLVGYQPLDDAFARCWIAAEDNAKARVLAITKAEALAAVIRALLAKPTSTDIKPAAVGAVSIERSRCYNRKTRRLEACYDI